MEMFAHFNYKKLLLIILVIITIPFWLTIVNYIFEFIIELGKVTGTIVRSVQSGNICIY